MILLLPDGSGGTSSSHPDSEAGGSFLFFGLLPCVYVLHMALYCYTPPIELQHHNVHTQWMNEATNGEVALLVTNQWECHGATMRGIVNSGWAIPGTIAEQLMERISSLFFSVENWCCWFHTAGDKYGGSGLIYNKIIIIIIKGAVRSRSRLRIIIRKFGGPSDDHSTQLDKGILFPSYSLQKSV